MVGRTALNSQANARFERDPRALWGSARGAIANLFASMTALFHQFFGHLGGYLLELRFQRLARGRYSAEGMKLSGFEGDNRQALHLLRSSRFHRPAVDNDSVP